MRLALCLAAALTIVSAPAQGQALPDSSATQFECAPPRVVKGPNIWINGETKSAWVLDGRLVREPGELPETPTIRRIDARQPVELPEAERRRLELLGLEPDVEILTYVCTSLE